MNKIKKLLIFVFVGFFALLLYQRQQHRYLKKGIQPQI